MQVFDIKVHLSTRNNGSYLEIPKEVVEGFTNNGKEEAFLVYLPFRHSSVLKNLGVTKEDYQNNFEQSGLTCSLLTMSQYYHLLYITVKEHCKGDRVKESEFLRYFGSRTADSKTGRFMIPDTLKCNFVGGKFKLIMNPKSSNSIAEIMEDCNIVKLAKLLETKRKLETQNIKKLVGKKSSKKLIANTQSPSKTAQSKSKSSEQELKKMPRPLRIKYNTKNPDGKTAR